MNYERSELLDRLAASHALGTMPPRAARRFARVLADSAAARRALARWHDVLAPLSVAVAPVQPPERVWQAIAARVAPRAAPSKPGWRARLAAPLASWGRLAIGAALGASLAFGAVSLDPHRFGMHHVSASLPASYVGILADAEGRAVLAAGSHRHGATMTIRILRPLAIPAGRVARLWALPADGGAPIPVANVPGSGKVTVTLGASAEARFGGVERLAVSFEADPDAAAPSAPYVLSGHCVRFW